MHKRIIMNMMDLFKSCLGKIRNIRKGFTLTEILIALAVIAIIVVLVLPVVTSRAQNKSFALAYDAEVKEIFSSLEGLTLNENFNPILPIFCLRTSQITLTTLYTTKL